MSLSLQRELAEIDAYLLAAMQPYAWSHGLLQTIPGIDEVAAALIILEIGDDMARFGSPARLACWAALSPGNNESAGLAQVRPHAACKQCNSLYLVRVRQCSTNDQKQPGLEVPQPDGAQVRKSHKKAIVAVAHKMIRLIYCILSRRTAYLDQGIDYAQMTALDQATQGHRQVACDQRTGRIRRPLNIR